MGFSQSRSRLGRSVYVVGLGVLLIIAVTRPARPPMNAESASPATGGPVPAEECPTGQRAPSVDEVVAAGGTPAPSVFSVGTPAAQLWTGAFPQVQPNELPTSGTVPDSDLAAIRATLRQLAACSNGREEGDLLYTDDYYRRNATIENVQGTASVVMQLVAFPDGALEPSVARAWRLDDGRIGVIVRAEGLGPLVIVFARDGASGAYLVDEVADLVVDGGTPPGP